MIPTGWNQWTFLTTDAPLRARLKQYTSRGVHGFLEVYGKKDKCMGTVSMIL